LRSYWSIFNNTTGKS